MTPQAVVCDTGPILHLHEAHALQLLARIPSVCVPERVELELSRLIETWENRRPDWLKVVALQESSPEEAAEWVQAGLIHNAEADALALARQLKADWYLTDDTAARALATSLGIETHGSLGLILWAAANGHIDQAQSETRLQALFGSSLWISPAVRLEAQTALRRIFGDS